MATTLKGLLGYINDNTPKSDANSWRTIKELWGGFGNNPRNQESVDAIKGMFGLLPLGAGDVASGLLAADDVRRGDYLSAGLNGVGVLPYVPALGGVLKGKGDDIAKAVAKVEDYQGLHKPPMKGSGAPLHDLTGGGDYYPDDVYSPMGMQYYGTGDRAIDSEAWNLAKMAKDRPDMQVTMYRAIPNLNADAEKEIKALNKVITYKDKFGFFPMENDLSSSFRQKYEDAGLGYDAIKDNAYQDMLARVAELRSGRVKNPPINHGDWVTTSRAYAKQHGESALNGDYKILSKSVPARKLFTNGDSWAEYGYDETGKINPNMLPLLTLGGLLGGYGIYSSQDDKWK